MRGHIPGPWRVTLEHDETGCTRFRIQQHIERQVIASSEWCLDQYGVETFAEVLFINDADAADDSRIKTARLVSAAPVMLMALSRVGCQDQGSCGSDERDGLCFVCEAIEEAEGKS